MWPGVLHKTLGSLLLWSMLSVFAACGGPPFSPGSPFGPDLATDSNGDSLWSADLHDTASPPDLPPTPQPDVTDADSADPSADGDAADQHPADAPAQRVLGFPVAPSAIPEPPDPKQGFRFVVISDSNGQYGQEEQPITTGKAVAQIIQRYKPAFVIHNGDMVAGQKSGQSESLIRSMWEHYHTDATLPLRSASIPLMPVPGNHDADPNYPDRALYKETWLEAAHVPQLPLRDGEHYPFYYSFTYGGALFCLLDGATGKTLDQPQLDWLAEQLSSGRHYPLAFVFSHLPIAKLRETDYGTLNHGQDLYDLLVVERVNALFSGHYEVYYKGFLGELPIVSDGFVSGGCHYLTDDDVCQQKTFVIVDVIGDQIAQLFAVEWAYFDKIFDESALPLKVEGYRRFDQP